MTNLELIELLVNALEEISDHNPGRVPHDVAYAALVIYHEEINSRDA